MEHFIFKEWTYHWRKILGFIIFVYTFTHDYYLIVWGLDDGIWILKNNDIFEKLLGLCYSNAMTMLTWLAQWLTWCVHISASRVSVVSICQWRPGRLKQWCSGIRGSCLISLLLLCFFLSFIEFSNNFLIFFVVFKNVFTSFLFALWCIY